MKYIGEYILKKKNSPLIVICGFLITSLVILFGALFERPLYELVIFSLVSLCSFAVWTILDHRIWQKEEKILNPIRFGLGKILRSEIPAKFVKGKNFKSHSLLNIGPPGFLMIRGLDYNHPAAKELMDYIRITLGYEYVIDYKKSESRKFLFLSIYDSAKEQLSFREKYEKRIKEGALSVLGDGVKITADWEQTPEEPDYLTSVKITGFNGMNLAGVNRQRQAISRLRTRLPKGNFVAECEPQEDYLMFTRAKPLPRLVVHSPEKIAPIKRDRDYQKFKIPLGVASNDVNAYWHPAVDPHVLIIGGTGGGKTICEHGIIQTLSQAAWRLWLLDGKRVEFIGYREWDNVEFLAQNIESQVRLICLAHEIMDYRYNLIQEGKIRFSQLEPIVLVIDELTSFLVAAESFFDQVKGSGQKKSPIFTWLDDIIRLGRTAKIHVVIGMQRPDARIINGEMRDNLGCRISLGRLNSKEGSLMMWADAAIGLQLPKIPGRSIANVDGIPTQVQATYSANPDPTSRDYNPGMVAAARPEFSIYTRKSFGTVKEKINDKGDSIPAEWNDYISAPILDSDGKEIVLDPVRSEESKLWKLNKFPAPNHGIPLVHLDSMKDISSMFPSNAGLIYGREVSKSLSIFKGDFFDFNENKGADLEVNINADNLIPHEISILDVSEGEKVIIEEVGEEIRIKSIEENQEDEKVTVQGYTNEGEYVILEVDKNLMVDTFSERGSIV